MKVPGELVPAVVRIPSGSRTVQVSLASNEVTATVVADPAVSVGAAAGAVGVQV